jgi:hypothetical protein
MRRTDSDCLQDNSISLGRQRPRGKRLGRRRRGATLVEFAIVAPIFFLMVLALVEFGRMVMVQQILTNAAREGARQAILYHLSRAEVESVVGDYLTKGSIPTAIISISPETPFDKVGFGEPVAVTVAVPFGDVSWIPTPQFLGNIPLSSTAVMRAERPE